MLWLSCLVFNDLLIEHGFHYQTTPHANYASQVLQQSDTEITLDLQKLALTRNILERKEERLTEKNPSDGDIRSHKVLANPMGSSGTKICFYKSLMLGSGIGKKKVTSTQNLR